MALKIIGKGKRIARQRRHLRLRKKVAGTTARPRLVVTRSSRHMIAQVVDDTVGHTLVSASTLEADTRVWPARSSTTWTNTCRLDRLTTMRGRAGVPETFLRTRRWRRARALTEPEPFTRVTV
jgi:hypothetical protein